MTNVAACGGAEIHLRLCITLVTRFLERGRPLMSIWRSISLAGFAVALCVAYCACDESGSTGSDAVATPTPAVIQTPTPKPTPTPFVPDDFWRNQHCKWDADSPKTYWGVVKEAQGHLLEKHSELFFRGEYGDMTNDVPKYYSEMIKHINETPGYAAAPALAGDTYFNIAVKQVGGDNAEAYCITNSGGRLNRACQYDHTCRPAWF
jgi:hypothetical protein